jgi:hypothetical protein
VCELEHAEHARDADRAAADRGFVEAEGLAIRARNRSLRAAAGRGLAAVVAPELLLRFRPVQENAPPPMPEDSGSTRPRTSCTAIAASTGEPPRLRIS